MSKGRYYFPELAEDDALCAVANLSRQTLREGEKIVEVLRKNYNILYDQSSRKISFLMEESNYSIFDLSPIISKNVHEQKENASSIRQESEPMSTPVKKSSCLPRKHLSIDPIEKEYSETENTDTFQKKTLSHKDIEVKDSNASDDENVASDKSVVAPIPKSPKGIDSPGAGNEESPRSSQTVALFTNLNVKENQSPELNKPNKTTDISVTNVQILDNPYQIAQSYQQSADLVEEIQTSKLITKENHTPSPIKKSKISGDPATNIQAFDNSTEKPEIAGDLTQDTMETGLSVKSNKMSGSPLEWNKSVGVAELKRKSLSPRWNRLISQVIPRIICSEGTEELDIELSWESEENSSPKTSSKLAGNKFDETQISSRSKTKSPEIVGLKVKTSPKINEPQFNLCEKNLRVSPICLAKSISPSGDKVYYSLKKTSPSDKQSKLNSSPKFFKHQVSPLKENTHIFLTTKCQDTDKDNPISDITLNSNYLNASTSPKTMEFEMNSPSQSKDCAFKKLSSPSALFRDETSIGNYYSSSVNLNTNKLSDFNIITSFKDKLARLISQKDQCMKEIFENFSIFQKELHFLFIYVKKVVYVVNKFPNEAKECITVEFENFTSDLKARALKLAEKLNMWKSTGDSEVQMWIQCFEEIKHMKSNYETRINPDTSTENSMRILQEYEKNLKSVWKKMIDMKYLEDTRRSLLLNSSFEFEKVMKQFVKSLIIVGIVKPRSETVST